MLKNNDREGIQRRWASRACSWNSFLPNFLSEWSQQPKCKQAVSGGHMQGRGWWWSTLPRKSSVLGFLHHGARRDSQWPVIKKTLSLYLGVRTGNFVACVEKWGNELGLSDPLGRDCTCGLLYKGHWEAGLRAPGRVRIDPQSILNFMIKRQARLTFRGAWEPHAMLIWAICMLRRTYI